MIFSQTTENDKYLSAVGKLAPATLAALVNRYKFNRAVVLGLPIPNGQIGPDGVPMQVQQAKINLAAKIAALGTNAGALLEASGELKAFLEKWVNAGVQALGGFTAVNFNGEWGFIQSDLVVDGTGAITGYSLPGVPFIYTVPRSGQTPAQSYTVSFTINADGTASAPTFTPIGGAAPNNNPL